MSLQDGSHRKLLAYAARAAKKLDSSTASTLMTERMETREVEQRSFWRRRRTTQNHKTQVAILTGWELWRQHTRCYENTISSYVEENHVVEFWLDTRGRLRRVDLTEHYETAVGGWTHAASAPATDQDLLMPDTFWRPRIHNRYGEKTTTYTAAKHRYGEKPYVGVSASISRLLKQHTRN